MKKYRLKKDLPFARIGDPVEKRHNDELGVYFWYVYNRNSDEWWQLGCDLLIDADEWIEEVKAEEFHKEKCADCRDQLKEKEAFVLLVCKKCWNQRFHQSCLRGS